MFIPNSKKLSVLAADQICKVVNESNKEEQIIKISKYADVLGQIQVKLCHLLKDGKLDETEKEQLAKDIEPFIEKLMKLI